MLINGSMWKYGLHDQIALNDNISKCSFTFSNLSIFFKILLIFVEGVASFEVSILIYMTVLAGSEYQTPDRIPDVSDYWTILCPVFTCFDHSN